jgi:CRP-like cAMP-binding protein
MDNPSQDIDIHALLQPTVFGQMGAEPLQEVVNFARIERYNVPTLLNAAGSPLQLLRLVVEGHIEIVARRASGREVAVSDVGPGSWATWLPCFIPRPPEHDFYSSANACFIALPVKNVRQFCDQNPQIYPHIMGEIGQRLRLLMEWTGQSVLIGPEQRMAKLIHILARDQKLKTNSGTLHATQTRLASLARCSRQSANSLLGALEKRGFIQLAYGKFEILDLAKLVAFSEVELED